MSKIFEYCLLPYFKGICVSDRQFGFREGLGCNNSIHTVKKVINYFNSRNTTVNVGVIDLRKAFDKVNIYGLLCMLQEHNVNLSLVNILENWFCKCFSKTHWSGAWSNYVSLTSGVRQGGILSPVLFTLYVDVVLSKLEASALGCFVNYQCYNSFMYADDIIILSISVTELQSLFNICADVFKGLDLPINDSKSHCMRIGPRCGNPCAYLTINDSVLEWVDNINFLGVTICKAKIFKCCWNDTKTKFFVSSNTIIGRLGSSAPLDVLLKLINTHGLQNLLYGSSATGLTIAELSSFAHAYNSIFAKIFHTTCNNTIRQCQFYSGNLSFNMIYELQRYTFLRNLLLNDKLNKTAKIDECDYLDFIDIGKKYNFNINNSVAMLKGKLWHAFKLEIDLI